MKGNKRIGLLTPLVRLSPLLAAGHFVAPVTSSLTKDMNSAEDLYRANSIRVLSRIIDATMLGAIERSVARSTRENIIFT